MRLLFFAACLFVAGCSGTACHERKQTQLVSPSAAVAADDRVRGETIWIYKPDGSLQCERDGKSHISIEQMSKDLLPTVQILDSKQRTDGQIHADACGTPTDRVNTYLIRRSDLEVARKKGFKEWIYE